MQAITDLFKNNPIQSAILAVLVAIAGWSWNTNNRTIELGASLANTERRVEAIASALPDINVRVASEAIHRNNRSTVFALEQSGAIDQSHALLIGIADSRASKIAVYTSRDMMQTTATSVLFGAVSQKDTSFLTFERLEQLSVVAQDPLYTPNVLIDSTRSLVSQLDASVISESIMAAGFEKKCEISIRDGSKLSSWDSLVSSLKNDSRLVFANGFEEAWRSCVESK